MTILLQAIRIQSMIQPPEHHYYRVRVSTEAAWTLVSHRPDFADRVQHTRPRWLFRRIRTGMVNQAERL